MPLSKRHTSYVALILCLAINSDCQAGIVLPPGGTVVTWTDGAMNGNWHDAAYDRLAELGAWMAVNGEAIYQTRTLSPYEEGKVRFTRRTDGTAYAIYLADEGEERLPASMSITALTPASGATISLLGGEVDLPWNRADAGFVVKMPEPLRSHPPGEHAWIFKISALEQDRRQ